MANYEVIFPLLDFDAHLTRVQRDFKLGLKFERLDRKTEMKLRSAMQRQEGVAIPRQLELGDYILRLQVPESFASDAFSAMLYEDAARQLFADRFVIAARIWKDTRAKVAMGFLVQKDQSGENIDKAYCLTTGEPRLHSSYVATLMEGAEFDDEDLTQVGHLYEKIGDFYGLSAAASELSNPELRNSVFQDAKEWMQRDFDAAYKQVIKSLIVGFRKLVQEDSDEDQDDIAEIQDAEKEVAEVEQGEWTKDRQMLADIMGDLAWDRFSKATGKKLDELVRAFDYKECYDFTFMTIITNSMRSKTEELGQAPSSPLALALQLFDSSFTLPFPHDFLSIVIALEALYAKGAGETQHRFSCNVAHLLGEYTSALLQEKLEYYERAKRIYGARSEIVHANKSVREIKNFGEIYQDCFGMTRKTLHHILTDSQLFKLFSSSETGTATAHRIRDFFLEATLRSEGETAENQA